MKKIFLPLTILFLFSFCCKRDNSIATQSKTAEKERTFYKVTNRPLSRYFKNPADSNKLGNIVPTGLLTHDKFVNDTIEQFFIKIGLCNNDMSAKVYIPCLPHFIAALKLNDQNPNNNTLIGHSNALPELYDAYQDDNGIFTHIYMLKNEKYVEMQYLTSALIGYYIDDFGNKMLVNHDDVNVFLINDKAEYFNDAMVLYRWKDTKYVPDSLLTVAGGLIPKDEYERKYRQKIPTIN